jgi:hypothetical protein
MPKSGKTFLALSFPKPLIIFSLDIGIERVLRNLTPEEQAQITVKTYNIPIVDTMRPQPYAQKFWREMTKDYEDALKLGTYKTIVVDTGTLLYELARHAYAEELGIKNLMPVMYGEVYTRLSALILKARLAGMNVVWTHYLREKYIDDKNTGELEMDGYKRAEGIVDMVITMQCVTKKVGSKVDNRIVATVDKCGFDFKLNGTEIENCKYKDIIDLLGV